MSLSRNYPLYYHKYLLKNEQRIIEIIESFSCILIQINILVDNFRQEACGYQLIGLRLPAVDLRHVILSYTRE